MPCNRARMLHSVRVKLFATDLDGTLIHGDERIHPRDREAIALARQRGVVVTIATGRLTSRTHPVARALSLEVPLVCADGGVLACGATERVLHREPLAADLVEPVLEAFGSGALATFVLTEDTIHACRRGESHHVYMRGWASQITVHGDVRAADIWQRDPQAAIILLGIGDGPQVQNVARALADFGERAAVDTFQGTSGHVVRVTAKGVSKGAALARLASQLGVAREHVAVAGDFWNDLSMFEYAGRSFAMPHAPAEVRAAATHALDHDVARHGAFADALTEWLEDVS